MTIQLGKHWRMKQVRKGLYRPRTQSRMFERPWSDHPLAWHGSRASVLVAKVASVVWSVREKLTAEVSYLADGDVGRLGRSAVIMTVGTREMVPVAMTGPHAGKQLGGRGA